MSPHPISIAAGANQPHAQPVVLFAGIVMQKDRGFSITGHQNIEPDERRNGWSHVRALLTTQASVCLPIAAGQVGLGRWQRLFLVELDGPRTARTVVLQAWGRPVARPRD